MTGKPRILDLFCGAGGAGMGYHLAGFDVVGVDINPQPNYPFEFHQGDARSLLWRPGEFQAVHASPPCQGYSTITPDKGRHPRLIEPVRDLLAATGVPYVIENVPGAHLPGAFTLCGRSFGIAKLRRHRKFLTSFPVLVPPCACGKERPIGVYGELSRNDRALGDRTDGYRRGMRAGVDTARELLGCHWMDAHELSQAIPPAYTHFIGEQLLAAISLEASS